MTQGIRLDAIRLDGGTQPRTAISEETVANYAEHMRSLAPVFPPIVLFFDGVDRWLADGFHRVHAAMRIGRAEIAAEIRVGTRRDAVLFSACANQTHGLQRTNADKRKAASTLLDDAEWRQWNNCEIGRRVGVSEALVRELRPHFEQNEVSATGRRVITRHGTEATMHTEHIGKSKTAMPDRSKAAVAQRKQDIRDMAERGFTTRQMAVALAIGEETIGNIAKSEAIVIHADHVVGATRRHDPNRIVDRIVIDAENLTAGTELIDYSQLDPSKLDEWIASLNASRKLVGVFVRRLEQEQKRHGEAA